MGKIRQSGASLVDRLGHTPRRLGIVAFDPFADALQILGRPAVTSGFPSRLQESFKAFADLFVRQELAALQGVLAALDGLDEAGLFLKILRENLLDEIVWTFPVPCGELR
jgi:hypothetical protein